MTLGVPENIAMSALADRIVRINIRDFEEMVNDWRRHVLRAALERAQGNQCQAADLLHIHRNTLSRWMEKLDITVEHYSRRARPAEEARNGIAESAPI